MLRATRAYTFLASKLPQVLWTWCVLYILTSKCASPHNGVQFFISHLTSGLRTRRFSEPTFRPSGATNHWKNTVFRDFPTFSRTWIFLLLRLSLLVGSVKHFHIFTSSHPHIFTSSHLHIFSSSHPHDFTSSHLHIFSSSHLHIFTSSHLHNFTSSHPHIFTSSLLIFTSSHLHIFSSSHLHILTSSHPHIFTFSLALLLSPSFISFLFLS